MGSLTNMFKRIGQEIVVSSDPNEVLRSTKLVIPGVGAFDRAMNNINKIDGLREALDVKALKDKIPILGICLGMQILTKKSEEGNLSGLGWVPAEAYKFPYKKNYKVPHMGWNKVIKKKKGNDLTKNLSNESRYYFVHSYYVKVYEEKYSLLKTQHDLTFDSAICNENLFGVQFHPEKSHKFGMNILKNFSEIKC